jgi:DNA (cytosine-5)-methyltransferase 1
LDAAYEPLRSAALSLVKKKYNILDGLKIVANEYGAPTKRIRIFFIGFRADLKIVPGKDDFLPPKYAEDVRIKRALKGLPVEIDPNWQKEEDGWRPFEEVSGGLFEERVVDAVPEDLGDPGALKRFFHKKEVSGCLGTRHSPKVEARYGALKAGEQDRISKSVRLDLNGLCPTLRAGTDISRGKFQAVRPIHPLKPRVITPREAARLQGFPDWFVFHSTKWHSFRQIGNSVSPIAAEEILIIIKKLLR